MSHRVSLKKNGQVHTYEKRKKAVKLPTFHGMLFTGRKRAAGFF